MKYACISAVVMAGLAATGRGAAVPVSEETNYIVAGGNGCVLVPSFAWNDEGYPADVGTPSFWFDANDRTGWEYDTSDPATVVKVPSRTNNGRYLTRDPSGFRVPSSYAPVGATLVTNLPALSGGAALDFGAYGSMHGLFFNVEEGSVTETTPDGVNRLSNVGSVMAVYDSSENGGWIMGGPYDWVRGRGRARYTGSYVAWDNPLFYSGGAAALYYGYARHNGFVAHAHDIGLAGGWQVLALVPTNLVAYASGVGVGNNAETSGGQKIAELLVFDKVLTMDECARVEAYLRAKWFPDDSAKGVNGHAFVRRVRAFTNDASTVAGAVRFEVAPQEGETLEIAQLRGGRGKSAAGSPRAPALVVTGGGTVELGDAAVYGGTVELRGGVLAFPCRAVPAAPAANCDFRFDASAAGALTSVGEGGRQYVTFWRNEQSPVSTYRDVPVCGARSVADDRRPVLIEHALGPGRHAVDFGVQGSSGAYLRLVTNETADISGLRNLDLAGVTTYIAVMGAERGGGDPIDVQSARRGNATASTYIAAIAPPTTIKAGSASYSSDPQVFLNGAKWYRGRGFETPAFQVVSVQSCADVSYFSNIAGNYNDSQFGGMKIAELLVYRRILSEREVLDTHAYLMKKWLGRTAPGYARAADEEANLPDIQDAVVESASEIRVERGSVRIRSLTVNADLVKSGDGDLIVEVFTNRCGNIAVTGGAIRLAPPADPDNICRLAAAPSLHLDAAHTNSMTLVSVNDTNFVSCITSKDGRNAAFQEGAGLRPWLGSGVTLNGVPLIDFGTYGTDTQTATGSRFMQFAHALDAVRSVFLVWGTQNGGGQVLGSSGSLNYDVTQNRPYDFIACESGKTQTMYYQGASARYGEIRTNGVAVAWDAVRAPGYWLMETHLPFPLYASALCIDRGSSNNRGGQRLAELVVYERVLSEREKTATRNYLMKKWFGVEPDEAAFPAKPETGIGRVVPDPIMVIGTASVEIDADRTIREILGSGALEKTGAGTLTLQEVTGFTGTVSVAEGTLKLTGVPRAYDPAFTRDGLVFHLDANTGIASVTNDDGGIQVAEWASTVAGSGRAKAIKAPYLREYALNRKPVVDMPYSTMAAFWFHDALGAKHSISNIRTVLWVLGSQEGGGWMLGGGGAGYAWHRGQAVGSEDCGTAPADPVSFGSAAAAVRTGAWYVNGTKIKPLTTGLSGGWDQISYACDTNSYPAGADAAGLAMDSRNPGTNHRSGNQRLAELAVYDRLLADDEVRAAETYLNLKWGLNGLVRSNTNAVALALGAGTVLDCGGTNQYFAALSGSGTVTNGAVETAELIHDFAIGAWLCVDGAFIPAEGFKVTLVNLPASQTLEGQSYTLVESTAFLHPERFAVAEIAGCESLPADAGVKLSVSGGALRVRFITSGMLLILR